MSINEHQMSPADIRRLLDLLAERLASDGIDAHIHVIGGSAIALLFPDDRETRFTTDIDAAVSPSRAVNDVVAAIADDLNLSPTWFNMNASPFVPPREDSGGSKTGVTITIASVEELIAMKLAAARHHDLFDLGLLARHAGITDPQQLVDIAFDAYGEDSMVLTDSRDDYLVLARQAIDAERRRSGSRS